MPLRLVLDTQIWLDWLVFDDPGVRPIRRAQALHAAEIFIDAACEAELERALGYPLGKHTLDAAMRSACLAQCRRLAHLFDNALAEKDRAGLPRCRDPDDQKFLDAALAARADYLVTRDRALLELNRRRARALPFKIITPDAFAEINSGSDPDSV